MLNDCVLSTVLTFVQFSCKHLSSCGYFHKIWNAMNIIPTDMHAFYIYCIVTGAREFPTVFYTPCRSHWFWEMNVLHPMFCSVREWPRGLENWTMWEATRPSARGFLNGTYETRYGATRDGRLGSVPVWWIQGAATGFCGLFRLLSPGWLRLWVQLNSVCLLDFTCFSALWAAAGADSSGFVTLVGSYSQHCMWGNVFRTSNLHGTQNHKASS